MNKPHTCLVCDEGTLTEKTHSNYFQHGNHSITVGDLEGYRCDVCHVDLISPPQLRRNHVKIVDAKRKHDGLLTGNEIKAIRKRLQLTQKKAAQVFGGGANAFSKYERGDIIQSGSMDKLLRVADDCPQARKRLLKQGQAQYKKYASPKKYTPTQVIFIAIGNSSPNQTARHSDWKMAA